MAIAKPPVYKHGRKPSGQRLMYYLGHHEKREASFIIDITGAELTPNAAVAHIGDGIEGKDFWHSIIALHRAECDFLQEKLGLSAEEAAKEEARILAKDIAFRTGQEAPLIAIHMERESDGGMRWHYHPVGKGEQPSNLYGPKGIYQKIWDREMRSLMEGDKGIKDWDAHREWKALKEQHKTILEEQKKLQEDLAKAREERRKTTKGVQRIATIDRWTFGIVPGLGLATEIEMQKKDLARRDMEKRHFAANKDSVQRRHQVETEMLRRRYQARGTEGSSWQEMEQASIDRRRDRGLLYGEKAAALDQIDRLKDRSRKLRVASRLTLGVVPGLSLAAGISAYIAERKQSKIERQFKTKELDLIKQGKQAELKALGAHYKALGMEGCAEHRMRAKEVERKAAAATFKVKTRGMDRAAIRRLRQANGKAISAAKRTVTRTSGLALESARNALKKAQECARVDTPHHSDKIIEQHHESVRPATNAPKQVVSQAVRSTVQVGAEASKTVASAAAKLSVRTASATLKMAGGLAMAIPTGGASLKQASTSAVQDVGQGISEAGQEIGHGTLRTAKTAGVGAKDTLQSGVSSVMTLGVDSLPPAAREALLGLKKTATTTLAAGKDLVTLDLIGAGSNIAAGGLEVGKHAAGAIAYGTKGLPAVARMPLRVVEAIPLAGSVAKVARVGMEVGATLSLAAPASSFDTPGMEI